MKNYEKMSDFEVNAAVSMHVLWKNHRCEEVDCNDKTGVVSWADGANWHEFNPCNNPSDAWPIILEYQISIAKYEWIEKWDAHGGGVCVDYDHCIISNSDCSYSNKNPLRAAMVVFLMMQEQKS